MSGCDNADANRVQKEVQMADHAIRPEVVKALVATRRWDELTAQVAERARYCCEYCDLDFYRSPENYKLMQKDHIIPSSSDGPHELENLALACTPCNFSFKRDYAPPRDAATREQRINAARRYVEDRKKNFDDGQLKRERLIVGYE